MSTVPSWFERNARKTLLGIVAASLVLGLAAVEYTLERGLAKPMRGTRHVRLLEHAPLINLRPLGSRKRQRPYRLVVDLEARVPKQSRYLYDIVHLDTVGSELAAGIIAEELAKSDVVRRRSGSGG